SLISAVDTLLTVAGRMCRATPEQMERLLTMQTDLRHSVQTAIERIRAVIARLQRFIGLEEADLRQANINELINDVAILFQERMQHGVHLEFDLQPVPELMCRPQLLSVVFSSLLSNAFDAVNGDARIVVSTRREGTNVEVKIQDNGRGM